MSRLSIRPMQPEDLAAIAVQPAQAVIADDLTVETGDALRRAGLAFTAWAGGVPIAVGGVLLPMGRRALAWAVLSEAAGRHMRRLTRVVRAFLDSFGRAVDIGVAKGFVPGARWARLLGFRPMNETLEDLDTPENLELWRRPGGEG